MGRMNNVTKMKIGKPVSEVFQAFVDPVKIGNFWFTSSSERWKQGKTITLTYDEYDARGDIRIMEIKENQKIVFQWGADGEGHEVTITLAESGISESIVEVTEEGFNENEQDWIRQFVDNKEGWVYMLTCLKGHLEYGVQLRASLIK